MSILTDLEKPYLKIFIFDGIKKIILNINSRIIKVNKVEKKIFKEKLILLRLTS